MAKPTPTRSKWNYFCIALLVGVSLYVLVIKLGQSLTGSHTSKMNGFVNVLLQISGAKEQWALDHGITNIAQAINLLTEQDIAPYLKSSQDHINRSGFGFDKDGRPYSGFGEKYVINPLGVPPEVLLTRKLKLGRGNSNTLPKGTIIRLGYPLEEIILPGQHTNQPVAITPQSH